MYKSMFIKISLTFLTQLLVSEDGQVTILKQKTNIKYKTSVFFWTRLKCMHDHALPHCFQSHLEKVQVKYSK